MGTRFGPDETAIFVSAQDGDGLVQLVRSGDAAPAGGVFQIIGPGIRFNERGEIVTQSRMEFGGDFDGNALIKASTSGIQEFFRTGKPAMDGNGTLSRINAFTLGENGAVAAFLETEGSVAGNADNEIIFREGGGLPRLFLRDQALVSVFDPSSTNRRVNELSELRLAGEQLLVQTDRLSSTSGLVAINGSIERIDPTGPFTPLGESEPVELFEVARDSFSADSRGNLSFIGNTVGTPIDAVLLMSDGSDFREIARSGDPLPGDPDKTIGRPRSPRQIGEGRVLFEARINESPNGDVLLLGSKDGVVVLAREDRRAPTADGPTIRGLSMGAVSSSPSGNLIAYVAGVAGDSQSDTALFLTDGNETVQLGAASSAIGIAGGADSGSRYAVNDRGQVALKKGSTGQPERVSPSLTYEGGAGTWDDNTRWTLSLTPGPENQLEIAAAEDRVVAGPAKATTIHALSLGRGTAGTATLELDQDLTARAWVDVEPRGTLYQKRGTLTANSLGVAGVFHQEGGAVRVEDLALSGEAKLHGDFQATGLVKTRGDLILADTGQLRAERFEQTGGTSTFSGTVRLEESFNVRVGGHLEQSAGSIKTEDVLLFGSFTQSGGRMEVADRYRQTETSDVTIGGTVRSKEVSAQGSLHITEGGILDADAGALLGETLLNGEMIGRSGFRLAADAILEGSGMFRGSLLAENNSVLRPGDGIGTLTVDGTLELSRGAAVEIDILLGSDGSFEHDLLEIIGTAEISSATEFRLGFLEPKRTHWH